MEIFIHTVAGNINAQRTLSYSPIDNIWTAGLEISYDSYSNWANSINNTHSYLIVYPKTSLQVVSIVNWAYSVGRNVRVQGHRHSYPPITVSERDDPTKIIIIDMTRHMKKLRMGSLTVPSPGTKSGSLQLTTVVSETGASMEDFMAFAERNGYGIEMAPIVGGDATVGGVLAIGGHGAGQPALNEKLTGPGFTFGSVSNSIAEIKAVVWDERAKRYAMKTFARSDPEISAFIVHVGRAIITEVSLLVGKNYNMRCLSRVDVPGSELFAHPDNSTGMRTMTSFLDQSGRVDAIWFPFTESPWLKIWDVTDTKPRGAQIATEPYNYQFPFTFDNPQTPGTVFGPQTYQRLIRGLTENKKWDIWGPSKNTILYYNRTATPLVYSGFVVLTNRANVQLVLHDMVQFYLNLLDKYADFDQYPIDQYIKLRTTGLDNPGETLIPGAVAPDISPTSPMRSRPDFDVGVWMNTLTTTNRPYSDPFMTEFEQWAYRRYNGGDALVRPEWSKNWGHTNTAPFSDPIFLRETIPRVFGVEQWNRAVGILDKYDPHHVISNQFLRNLMVPYTSSSSGSGTGTNVRERDRSTIVTSSKLENPHGGFGWSRSEYLERVFHDIYG